MMSPIPGRLWQPARGKRNAGGAGRTPAVDKRGRLGHAGLREMERLE
jgi:hypothetical protein